MSNLTSLHKASLGLAIGLFMCVLPLPYGMYTIIRLATSIIMGCWAFRFLSMNRITLATISGGIVLLFQPFFKIALDRLTWNIIDVLLAIFLIIMVYRIDSVNTQEDETVR